jgi:hypothetical protein
MDLTSVLGFGVAGNFAGHLEQAGEAADFKSIRTAEVTAPKAVFPFYLPGMNDSFLSVYPLSSDTICFPEGADNLQIEPEVGVIFNINYAGDRVLSLSAECFGAYNDCSIRRPGARKISEKKNWGACSKGFSSVTVPIDRFSAGGVLDSYRIASFLIRDGQCHPYGVDSAVVDYSYMYEKLTGWIVDKMNNQKDEGPVEDINSYIIRLGRPARCLISIGATRYTEFGSTNYLKKGDLSVVAVYSTADYSPEKIVDLVSARKFGEITCPLLVQKVV